MSIRETCQQFHNYAFLEDQEFLAGWQQIRSNITGDIPKKLLEAKLFYFSRKFNELTYVDYINWLKKENVPDNPTTLQQNTLSQCEAAKETCLKGLDTSEVGSAVNEEPLSQSKKHISTQEDSSYCAEENVLLTNDGYSTDINSREFASIETAQSCSSSENSTETSVKVGFNTETKVNELTSMIASASIVESVDSNAGVEEEETDLPFSQVMELVQAGLPIPGTKHLNIKPTNSAPTPSCKPQCKKPWES